MRNPVEWQKIQCFILDWNSKHTPHRSVEVNTLKVLLSPLWSGWLLRNICVTNDHGYVPSVIIAVRSFPHSWLYHRICDKSNTMGATNGAGTAYPSGVHSVFQRGSCLSIFHFLCNCLYMVVCPFVLFLLVISLYILLLTFWYLQSFLYLLRKFLSVLKLINLL